VFSPEGAGCGPAITAGNEARQLPGESGFAEAGQGAKQNQCDQGGGKPTGPIMHFWSSQKGGNFWHGKIDPDS